MVPVFHIGDLAEGIAVLADLEGVGGFVVAGVVVNEFGGAEGEDEFADFSAGSRVIPDAFEQRAAEAGAGVGFFGRGRSVVSKVSGGSFDEFAGVVVACNKCIDQLSPAYFPRPHIINLQEGFGRHLEDWRISDSHDRGVVMSISLLFWFRTCSTNFSVWVACLPDPLTASKARATHC
ncbi:MAG: hypothetical protein IPG34_10975 [Rhodocyclaceae bacterium]|nr:hypothetical protein [Rhodocyclaceae bacterium]